MTSLELIQASISFLESLSPFIFALVVILYAEELIKLIRYAATAYKSSRWG